MTHSTLDLPATPPLRQSAIIFMAAVAGMVLAFLLGQTFSTWFCWLAVPFFIFGGNAFRHLPNLRKRWKAVLCVLYYSLGSAGLALAMLLVAFKNIGH